jgi:hypothetical protein
MHSLVSTTCIQWLIASGIFYALASAFQKSKEVYEMINKSDNPLDNTDLGIRSFTWSIMGSYVITVICMLGALVTAILDASSARNYSQQG